MKRAVIFIVAMIILATSLVYAEAVTMAEIIEAISTFTDEELVELANAVVMEQDARSLVDADHPAIDSQTLITAAEYRRGDRNTDVTVIQERLIELGYLIGPADGAFGEKTESAVLLFQKANALVETGIVDVLTRRVLFFAQAIDKETYDGQPIAVGDGWEITKEFFYNTNDAQQYLLLLKNTSGFNADISISVKFYDADEQLVGVANEREHACEDGHLTFWRFSNDIEFVSVTYEISVLEEKYYQDGGQTAIDVETSVVGGKVILSATNIGEKPVEFVAYNVLFLDEADDVVGTATGYFFDGDFELKPGVTDMREAAINQEFAKTIVVVHGRIRK